MYSIQEAGMLTGISRDMIRHYEKLGLVHPVRKSNGYREYSDDDLFQLVLIRLYSNLGINLKLIGRMTESGDISGMSDALRAEIEQTEFRQKLLASRAAAAKHTLHCLEQYQSENEYAVRTIHRRYLISRSAMPGAAYADLCARLTEDGCFFQYYYIQHFVREGAAFRANGTDLGLILYDPLPFEIRSTVELQPQIYYQKTLKIARGTMLDIEGVQQHLKIAEAYSHAQEFTVITYQVFTEDPGGGQVLICIEIPLGDTVRH